MSFSFAVPTSSVIALNPSNQFEVNVIEQTKKHNGRLTLVGGRVELPRQTHLDCVFEEWDQEAGGMAATLDNVSLWAIKTDPYSDVRASTLGKLSHETCLPEHRDIPVTGHYGAPDHLYLATVSGIPHPKDGEAKRCFYFDVRNLNITADEKDSQFGAQQDLILAVYRLFLAGRPVAVDDFVDFVSLRKKLPALLAAL
ncbi:MAG: hypothetical protein P4L53_23480 [Candidatus Obscuribacterales bacterium]|nr:hypothetical protein [Candidatus Obscuribacterales bacterium]